MTCPAACFQVEFNTSDPSRYLTLEEALISEVADIKPQNGQLVQLGDSVLIKWKKAS